MTDKQIIIDSVDVSGCKYFENTENEMCCSLHCCGGCRTYEDCDFKQLKRKEQDNFDKVKNHHKQTLDKIWNIAVDGWCFYDEIEQQDERELFDQILALSTRRWKNDNTLNL